MTLFNNWVFGVNRKMYNLQKVIDCHESPVQQFYDFEVNLLGLFNSFYQ